jgi:hypothetical protein
MVRTVISSVLPSEICSFSACFLMKSAVPGVPIRMVPFVGFASTAMTGKSAPEIFFQSIFQFFRRILFHCRGIRRNSYLPSGFPLIEEFRLCIRCNRQCKQQ